MVSFHEHTMFHACCGIHHGSVLTVMLKCYIHYPEVSACPLEGLVHKCCYCYAFLFDVHQLVLFQIWWVAAAKLIIT